MVNQKVMSAKIAAGLASAAGIAFVAGCGVQQQPDQVAGKQLFTQKCGTCHTLEDAQTKGVVGPNLDDAFANAIEVGEKRSTVEGVVRKQIELPMGTAMPANVVKGQEADEVAAYVAQAAAPNVKRDKKVAP